MMRLPLICSFSGSTRTLSASQGKCSASGVRATVMLLASFSAMACASSGCSRARPYLRAQRGKSLELALPWEYTLHFAV